MSWLPLMTAVAALGCVAIPNPGMYVAMGLGIIALATGISAFRRVKTPGAARLRGAGAIAVSLVALVLATAKYLLTLAAIDRLGQV